MSDSLIEVIPYSIDNLVRLFADTSGTPEEETEQKLHSMYFREYFDELQAKTNVVERNYVDHDFLEDYAKYYVKCFSEYKRFCTRLHFFSLDFSSEDAGSLFLGEDVPISFSGLKESYLGFIIAKPIPRTFVGRTCLSCYPPEDGRRYYPATRSYDAHLFGLTLRVDSLAFQEQDTVGRGLCHQCPVVGLSSNGKAFSAFNSITGRDNRGRSSRLRREYKGVPRMTG